MKSDVESSLPSNKEIYLLAGFTEIQLNIYKNFFSKTTGLVEKNTFLNILMQLKKVCNHPYLLEGVEEKESFKEETHLINTSGKMIILDKLLQKLAKEGHRVLIFCQMTKMLDILEDYCLYRQYNVKIP